jgi:hypothetical protein
LFFSYTLVVAIATVAEIFGYHTVVIFIFAIAFATVVEIASYPTVVVLIAALVVATVIKIPFPAILLAKLSLDLTLKRSNLSLLFLAEVFVPTGSRKKG